MGQLMNRFIQVTVKAHSGEPMNEAADALAAEEMDPTRLVDVDAESVHFVSSTPQRIRS